MQLIQFSEFRVRLLFVIVVTLFFAGNSALGEVIPADDPRLADMELTPVQKYAAVWQWIHDRYFDTSFNGQDWESWKNRFDGKLTTQAEATSAIDQMLVSLNDARTEYITTNIKKEPGSVGCVFGPTTDGRVSIIAVIKDSPAARAGIHYGDVLTHVDGQPAFGKVHECIVPIPGPVGSVVRLQFVRNGSPVSFEITRDDKAWDVKSVFTMLKGNLAYLLPSFPPTEEGNKIIKAAISDLGGAKAVGLILDLRGHPSGASPRSVADFCSYFAGKGGMFQIRTCVETKVVEGKEDALTNIPMIVLVDRTTNTEAEVVTACLKEHHRATVVGERTAGLGRLYLTERVDRNSWINIAALEFMTKGGSSFHGKGLQPDIIVSVEPQDVAKGPWWHYSIDRKPPSILTGSDVVLQRGIAELSKKTAR